MSVRKTLCRVDEIPDAGAIAVDVESTDGPVALILLREGARVFAYHNECPHQGRRLEWSPGQFLLERGQLICAAHGASFFIASGHCSGGPCYGSGLALAQIEVVEGDVLVCQ